MTYKLCVSVAVASAEKLEKLPGALHSTTEMLGWADAAGFETLRVDDSESEVTADLLKQKLQPLLQDPARTVDHLIFHFAGHGVAPNADDQFLLLSKWRTRPTEAIKLNLFARLLQYYQIGSVSLFIDACRSRPTDDAEEVHGTGVLDRPDERRTEFPQERFRAVAHAYQTFMLKGDEAAPPRCLFSNVLVRGLCGEFEEAIASRGDQSVITSAKLYHALTKHLPREAAKYRLDQTPSLQLGLVEPKDVYAVLPVEFRPRPLPPARLTLEILATTAKESIELALHNLKGLTVFIPDAQRLPAPSREKLPPSAASARRKQFDQDFRRFLADYSTEALPKELPSGVGIAFNGGAALELRGPPHISFAQNNGTNWWQARFAQDAPQRRSGDFAARLEAGAWVAGTILPGNVLAISLARRAQVDMAVSAIYRPLVDDSSGVRPEDVEQASRVSENTIALLRAGALTSDRALSIAAGIRAGKHINPMLGVLAAYLYDAAGDRDNIRRIAWFYQYNGQPIPFDVALLADVKGERASDGRLTVSLPAVSRREPSTPEEKLVHPDYFTETYACEDVSVAGSFPWLRQGWPLLAISELPVHPSLKDMASELLPAPFTTLKPDAGKDLANLIAKGGI